MVSDSISIGFASFIRLRSDQNKYTILGVERNANIAEIKKAYRYLAMLYHPDRHTLAHKTEAEETFKLINAAYVTLADSNSRALYDQMVDKQENKPISHDAVQDVENS